MLLFVVVEWWEIGLGSLFEDEVEGGLCTVVAVNTDVMVYVYLSVVTGMEAWMPVDLVSGVPRS